MKIVFVTRKFPPSVGGMEAAAAGLYGSLKKQHDVTLIKWGHSNRWLPFIYPWLTIRTIYASLRYRPAAIYVQDGLLAPLGAVAKCISRTKTVVSIHGLDITYSSAFYQWLLRHSIGRLDHVVAGSQWTWREAQRRFPRLPVSLITYGLADKFYLKASRDELLDLIGPRIGMKPSQLKERQILVTTGRLVERKGVEWFVSNVLPALIKQVPKGLYLICGDGPKKVAIQRAIDAHGLANHAILLGEASDETRNYLYNLADLFIMPNIPTNDDGEGFGLVAVEVSSCGTPVIGADLEGIKDAVSPTKNGLLVPARNAALFTKTIVTELRKPTFERTKVRSYVTSTYSWDKAATQYAKLFSD